MKTLKGLLHRAGDFAVLLGALPLMAICLCAGEGSES